MDDTITQTLMRWDGEEYLESIEIVRKDRSRLLREVSSYMPKKYVETLDRPTERFKISLEEGSHPWEWKTANVLPVLKKEDGNCIEF